MRTSLLRLFRRSRVYNYYYYCLYYRCLKAKSTNCLKIEHKNNIMLYDKIFVITTSLRFAAVKSKRTVVVNRDARTYGRLLTLSFSIYGCAQNVYRKSRSSIVVILLRTNVVPGLPPKPAFSRRSIVDFLYFLAPGACIVLHLYPFACPRHTTRNNGSREKIISFRQVRFGRRKCWTAAVDGVDPVEAD